jgi:hypothetical protein
MACLVVMTTAFGCDSTTAPSGPFQSNPPPTDGFVPTFTALTLGQPVKTVVGADDQRCVEDAQLRCHYFRVTPPTDGALTFALTYSDPKGNLDWVARDAAGGAWDRPGTIVIRSGWTYQLTVWEYEFPGLEYEVTVSLVPR